MQSLPRVSRGYSVNNLYENRPATRETEEYVYAKLRKWNAYARRVRRIMMPARIYVHPSRGYSARITAHIISYVRG